MVFAFVDLKHFAAAGQEVVDFYMYQPANRTAKAFSFIDAGERFIFRCWKTI